jgi:hypothetical protein
MRRLSIATALLLSCTAAPVTVPSPSPAVTASASVVGTASPSPSQPATQALVGTLTTSISFLRPEDPRGFTFPIPSDGQYAAASLSDGHGLYRLVAVDLASRLTRTVAVPDGSYGGIAGLDAGRLAISLWRPIPGGDVRGYDYEIEDLATTTRQTLDHFEIPGRFHSQGAAPAPDPQLVLGRNRVAYSHLYVQGDSLYAELRVGPIDGPMKIVITTTAVVAPIALSDNALLYVIQVGVEDIVHLYDLTTARDRILLRAPAGTTEHALTNDWYLYSTHQNSPTSQTGRLVLRDLATGVESILATGNCTYPSLNERYAIAGCADGGRVPTSLTAFELATLRPVEVARSVEPLAGPRVAPGVIYWVRFAGAPPITPYFELIRY